MRVKKTRNLFSQEKSQEIMENVEKTNTKTFTSVSQI